MNNTYVNKYDNVYRYLEKNRTARLVELKQHFDLSDSTIRRILNELERSRLVERFHGGARLMQPALFEMDIRDQKDRMESQKQQIGKTAAGMIEDGMTVVLLGGTTVQAICPYIMQQKLTVITNSLKIAIDLSGKNSNHIILLGGDLNQNEMEVYGPLTTQAFRSLRSDLAFVGATSALPTIGCTTSDLNAVETYRASMAASRKTILLAASNKFKPGGYAVVAPCSDIGNMITDWDITPEDYEAFEKYGIRITVAPRPETTDLLRKTL